MYTFSKQSQFLTVFFLYNLIPNNKNHIYVIFNFVCGVCPDNNVSEKKFHGKYGAPFYFNTSLFNIKIKTNTKPINHTILICVFISEITIFWCSESLIFMCSILL